MSYMVHTVTRERIKRFVQSRTTAKTVFTAFEWSVVNTSRPYVQEQLTCSNLRGLLSAVFRRDEEPDCHSGSPPAVGSCVLQQSSRHAAGTSVDPPDVDHRRHVRGAAGKRLPPSSSSSSSSWGDSRAPTPRRRRRGPAVCFKQQPSLISLSLRSSSPSSPSVSSVSSSSVSSGGGCSSSFVSCVGGSSASSSALSLTLPHATWRWLEESHLRPTDPHDDLGIRRSSVDVVMAADGLQFVVRDFKESNSLFEVLEQTDIAHRLGLCEVGPPVVGLLARERGLPSLVTRYLPGARDLLSLLTSQRRPSTIRLDVLDILRQAAHLLGIMHAHSFVHNHFMASSVMVVPLPTPAAHLSLPTVDGRLSTHSHYCVYLVDFSHATYRRGLTFNMTDAAVLQVFQQYPYLPPEVVAGGETGPSTDIFSFGATLLMIKDIFHGETLDSDLSSLVEQCLEENPGDRPSSVQLERHLLALAETTLSSAPYHTAQAGTSLLRFITCELGESNSSLPSSSLSCSSCSQSSVSSWHSVDSQPRVHGAAANMSGSGPPAEQLPPARARNGGSTYRLGTSVLGPRRRCHLPAEVTIQWLRPAAVKLADGPPMGEGTFAQVVFATYKDATVIVKIFKSSCTRKISTIMQEADINAFLGARGITTPFVGLLQTGRPGGPPSLVMSYQAGCTELYYLLRDDQLTGWDFTDIFLQITRLLAAIHRFGFVHNDLKATNLIAIPVCDQTSSGFLHTPPPAGVTGTISSSSRYRVYLIDFSETSYLEGAAFNLDADALAEFQKYPYLPPEVVHGRSKTAPSTDVYSLGLLLANTSVAPAASGIQNELLSLAKQCMATNPAKRPTMEDLERALYSLREQTLQGTICQLVPDLLASHHSGSFIPGQFRPGVTPYAYRSSSSCDSSSSSKCSFSSSEGDSSSSSSSYDRAASPDQDPFKIDYSLLSLLGKVSPRSSHSGTFSSEENEVPLKSSRPLLSFSGMARASKSRDSITSLH